MRKKQNNYVCDILAQSNVLSLIIMVNQKIPTLRHSTFKDSRSEDPQKTEECYRLMESIEQTTNGVKAIHTYRWDI